MREIIEVDAYLRVNQDANDFAVTDHLVEVIFDGLLSQIIGPLLAGLSESLLLARVPEFVGGDDGKELEWRNKWKQTS